MGTFNILLFHLVLLVVLSETTKSDQVSAPFHIFKKFPKKSKPTTTLPTHGTVPPATTKKPWTKATKQPYTTSTQPYTTTKQPYTTTKQQYTTTKQQYTTTKQQYTTTKQQYTTTKQQYTTTKQQYTTTKHPKPTTKRCKTTTSRPICKKWKCEVRTACPSLYEFEHKLRCTTILLANPKDECSFFMCAPVMTHPVCGPQIGPVLTQCPVGTVFVPKLRRCDYKYDKKGNIVCPKCPTSPCPHTHGCSTSEKGDEVCCCYLDESEDCDDDENEHGHSENDSCSSENNEIVYGVGNEQEDTDQGKDAGNLPEDTKADIPDRDPIHDTKGSLQDAENTLKTRNYYDPVEDSRIRFQIARLGEMGGLHTDNFGTSGEGGFAFGSKSKHKRDKSLSGPDDGKYWWL